MRLAALLATVLAVAALLAACGGGHPAQARSRVTPAAAARLVWKAGRTFTATVAFDEQDQGASADELQLTAHERFRVLRVRGGVATIRRTVTGWRWQRNTSQLLTGSLPGPATFAVDAAGRIVSGADWPLPGQEPLPGLDVFAAPARPSAGWARTDGAGLDLDYQAVQPTAPDTATLEWTVARPQFTRAGDPVTVSGHAQVTVDSSYTRHAATLTLRSTRERATFERTAESAAGSLDQSGTVVETTTFSLS